MPKALSANGIDIFLSINPAYLSFARCFSVNDFYNNQQTRTSNQLLLSFALAGVLLVLDWLGIPITASLRLSLRCKSFRDLLAVCRLHTLYGFSGSQLLLTVEHCPDFALAGGLLSPLLPPSQLLPVATTIFSSFICRRLLSQVVTFILSRFNSTYCWWLGARSEELNRPIGTP